MSKPVFELDSYFPHLEEFKHKSIFADLETPWGVLSRIGNYLESYIAKNSDNLPTELPAGLALFSRTMGLEEIGFQVEKLVEIQQDTIVAGTSIILEAGVVLEPGATIKGLAIIGAGSEVRQGAYLRGNVITGKRCTLGHTTEIKNSIFMNHTEAGHFAYVGDSVLGSYVNLGAGTKLANLQLRKAADKLIENFPTIKIKIDGKVVDTGVAKIGAFVGDHAELGCNSVIAPAVYLGAHSWVMANKTVSKGFYAPKSLLK